MVKVTHKITAREEYSLNIASSLTKQQMKLSKSIISFSAYRATRISFSLLFSLKPSKDKIHEGRSRLSTII